MDPRAAAPPSEAQTGLCPIVLVSDENFAMPLTTTLRSLVESNERHWPLDVTILTDRFSGGARARVEGSLPKGSAVVRWIEMDVSRYASLRPMAYLSKMTYVRLQLERCFDGDVRRVVYLDADILVLGDIADLVRMELGDCVVGAVADRWIDGLIRRGREGLPAAIPDVPAYFNAGILVIDLPKWRQTEVTERAMDFLTRCPQSPYGDQDALNVACSGAWKALPERWNYQGHLEVKIDRLSGDDRPAIVHFVTARKPWMPSGRNPNAGLYARFRDRTLFRQGAMGKARDAIATLFHRANRVRRLVTGPLRPRPRPERKAG